MSTVTVNKTFAIEITTQCVVYTDNEGQTENWSAIATLNGVRICVTKFGSVLKTEQQAIKEIKTILRAM